MNFLLALTPILLILFLMVGLRWGAARAGGAGYLAAFAISFWFGATPELLAYAHARALLLAVDVLLIIWAAFLLYRVADEAGAIRTIGAALPAMTADRGMQAIIIGWVFASFLQGVGGFGVPVAVVSPILVGLGFTPLAAVVIPSLGHGWAVTFGSLGSSFQALLATTGLSEKLLGPPAALFLGLSTLLVGVQVVHAAGGWQALRRLWWAVLVVSLVMGGVQQWMVALGAWNIASFLGGSVGLLITLPLARRYRGEQDGHNPVNIRSLLVALSGYVILIVLILGVQLTPAIHDFLGQVVIQVEFPEMVTRLGFVTPAGLSRKIPVFRHAGVLLLYAALLAYGVYRTAGLYKPGAEKRILNGTLQRVISSSVSIVSMVTMAVMMEHAGMTDALARGMAQGMGALYPLVAPWIGAIGAFMTGSNTNSNVVFSGMQMQTAQLLGISAAFILAGQTAGAALASVMAPTKVVVGASTAGMAGQEGVVMRKLVLYTAQLVLLISILTALGVWWTLD
jgi:lactate permease